MSSERNKASGARTRTREKKRTIPDVQGRRLEGKAHRSGSNDGVICVEVRNCFAAGTDIFSQPYGISAGLSYYLTRSTPWCRRLGSALDRTMGTRPLVLSYEATSGKTGVNSVVPYSLGTD